jgi:hypothetical protein
MASPIQRHSNLHKANEPWINLDDDTGEEQGIGDGSLT